MLFFRLIWLFMYVPLVVQTVQNRTDTEPHRHLTLFSWETVKRITFLGMGIIYPIIIWELPVPCPESSPNRVRRWISLRVRFGCCVRLSVYGVGPTDPVVVHCLLSAKVARKAMENQYYLLYKCMQSRRTRIIKSISKYICIISCFCFYLSVHIYMSVCVPMLWMFEFVIYFYWGRSNRWRPSI